MPGAATQGAETLLDKAGASLSLGTIYSQGPKLLTCDIPRLPPHPRARPVQSTLLSLLPFLFFPPWVSQLLRGADVVNIS